MALVGGKIQIRTIYHLRHSLVLVRYGEVFYIVKAHG